MSEGRRTGDRRSQSRRRKILRRLRTRRSGQDRRQIRSFGGVEIEKRTGNRRLTERRGEDRRVVQTG